MQRWGVIWQMCGIGDSATVQCWRQLGLGAVATDVAAAGVVVSAGQCDGCGRLSVVLRRRKRSGDAKHDGGGSLVACNNGGRLAYVRCWWQGYSATLVGDWQRGGGGSGGGGSAAVQQW